MLVLRTFPRIKICRNSDFKRVWHAIIDKIIQPLLTLAVLCNATMLLTLFDARKKNDDRRSLKTTRRGKKIMRRALCGGVSGHQIASPLSRIIYCDGFLRSYGVGDCGDCFANQFHEKYNLNLLSPLGIATVLKLFHESNYDIFR